MVIFLHSLGGFWWMYSKNNVTSAFGYVMLCEVEVRLYYVWLRLGCMLKM